MSFPDEYAQSSVVPVLSHVMATTVCLSFSCILYPLDCMSGHGMGIINNMCVQCFSETLCSGISLILTQYGTEESGHNCVVSFFSWVKMHARTVLGERNVSSFQECTLEFQCILKQNTSKTE